MFNKISKEELKRLRDVYKQGTRVELVYMNDPWSILQPGDTGTVASVDDIGTIHISWDVGSSLGVVYGNDKCKIIE